jgi:hypothetical protein
MLLSAKEDETMTSSSDSGLPLSSSAIACPI